MLDNPSVLIAEHLPLTSNGFPCAFAFRFASLREREAPFAFPPKLKYHQRTVTASCAAKIVRTGLVSSFGVVALGILAIFGLILISPIA
jgi:hypothetical protein